MDYSFVSCTFTGGSSSELVKDSCIIVPKLFYSCYILNQIFTNLLENT